MAATRARAPTGSERFVRPRDVEGASLSRRYDGTRMVHWRDVLE
jgi:hypothetical protein